jgi:hypothetical protein
MLVDVLPARYSASAIPAVGSLVAGKLPLGVGIRRLKNGL